MAMVAMHLQHQKGARPEACSGTDGGDTEAAAPNKSQRSTMAHRSSPHDGVTQKKNSLDVFVYNYLRRQFGAMERSTFHAYCTGTQTLRPTLAQQWPNPRE